MPTPSTTAPDLRAALTAAAEDPHYWSTPTGRDILTHALTTLRPIALRLNTDPADALSHAFEAWTGMSIGTLAAEDADLWAYTRTAVRRSLSREDEANRRGTSAAALRRAGGRDIEISTGLEGIEMGYEHDHHPEEQAQPQITDPRFPAARAALEQVLIAAGLDDAQRDILIDVLADLIEHSPSQRASIERALNARDQVAPGMHPHQWQDLVEVILGTPAGLPGIVQLAGSGHPSPAVEPHISSRLLSMFTAAA